MTGHQFINHPTLIKSIQKLLIGLFIVLIGLDIYLAIDDVDFNTISNVILRNTDDGLFILTYFWGALAANFFITKKETPLVSPTVGTVILIAIACIVAYFDIGVMVTDFMVNHDFSIYKYSISMVFGFLIAMVFWRLGDNTTV